MIFFELIMNKQSQKAMENKPCGNNSHRFSGIYDQIANVTLEN